MCLEVAHPSRLDISVCHLIIFHGATRAAITDEGVPSSCPSIVAYSSLVALVMAERLPRRLFLSLSNYTSTSTSMLCLLGSSVAIRD